MRNDLSQTRLGFFLQGAPRQSVLELIYLAYLAVYTVVAFSLTTMIPITFSQGFLDLLMISEVLAVVVKTYTERDWNWGLFFWAAVVILPFAWTRHTLGGGHLLMLETAVLIVGAHGISFDKILKVYLIAALSVLAVTMLLALTGVIENLIYYRNGHQRISFGVIYPTDFSAHVFFLVCGYVWLRERRIRYWEIAGIVLLALFCYWFCEARNTALCLLVLVLLLLYLNVRRALAEKRGRGYRMSKLLSGLLVVSMPLATLLMIMLTAAYRDEIPWLVFLNKLLSGRLALGRIAFETYPVTWHGQYVYMNGLGRSLEGPSNYFYLDSSYINILFRFGILTLVVVVGIMVLGARRQQKLGSWERLCLFAVIALHCMIEHHLIQIAYDPFLLTAFAALSQPRGPAASDKQNTEESPSV